MNDKNSRLSKEINHLELDLDTLVFYELELFSDSW